MKTFFNIGTQSLKGAFYAALFEETRPAANHRFLELWSHARLIKIFLPGCQMKAFLCFSAQSLKPNFSSMQLQTSQWIKIWDEFGRGWHCLCSMWAWGSYCCNPWQEWNVSDRDYCYFSHATYPNVRTPLELTFHCYHVQRFHGEYKIKCS